MTLPVDTSGRLYDAFIRLIFFHTHREASALDNELPQESDQFRFLRDVCLGNLKGSVGLILAKSLGHTDFYPLRPFISVFHHCLVSSVFVVPHRF